jgi:hypothetical protein
MKATARLGSSGLGQIQQHPWLRDIDWAQLESGIAPTLPTNSPLVQEFPTAPPARTPSAPPPGRPGSGRFSLRLSSSRGHGGGAGPGSAGAVAGSEGQGGGTGGTKEDLRRALLAHMQAPAVSADQQQFFRR